MMKLLLIEDDRMIGWSLHRGLSDEGFSVDWLDDGDMAGLVCSQQSFDVAILDLGLPNRDGLQVLAELRHQGNTLPVVILTARESVAERIKGLNAGADDYVCKPFDFDELVARVRAVMRRRAGLASAVLQCRDISLNPTTRRVSCKGELINLSAKEFALLEFLLQRPGVVLSREQLRSRLYGWDADVGSNTVEVFIHALRRKLGRECIENVRSIGYRLSDAGALKSIRGRLSMILLVAVFSLLVGLYTLIYSRIEDEVDELFDAELQRTAIGAILDSAQPLIPLPPRKAQNPQEGMVISTWPLKAGATDHDNARPLKDIARSTPIGFSKQMLDGREWRLFATTSDDYFVVSAQPKEVRDKAARQITRRILLPTLGILPIAAIIIALSVYLGLWPLAKIAEGLRSRSHRDLSPIKLPSLPSDIKPLVAALNELMARLSAVIDSQKRFIADAAHELLTPLTALQLQAQMLARAKSPTREREAMAELRGGIARTLELAKQLLRLARHDGDVDAREHRPVDLVELVRRLIMLNAPLAAQKKLNTELRAPATMSVMGDDESLAILGSNLIDNAIKYVDYGGSIRISVQRQASRIALHVEDSGPSIPVNDRERVFDRFYRRRDSLAGGNGLGLAIAKDIALRHGASITLESSTALGGLNAIVYFPLGPD